MNWINIILSVLISCFVAIFTIGNLSNNRIQLKNIIKFVLIMLPLGIITCTFFEGVIRIILNIMITIISLYFSLFEKNISKSVYYTIIYEIFAIIVEILLSMIFVMVLKLDINSYESFSFSLLLFSIFNSIIILFISKIKFIILENNKLFHRLAKNNTDWSYIIIVVILLIFLITFNRYNLSNNLDFYINTGMIIFVFVTLIYVIYNNFQKLKVEDKYNEMMEYVSKYEKIINEQGKKNHEFNNQLMVLKGYIKKPDKLKEYLDLIIQEQRGGQNYDVKQLSALPDGGIKGLIYHKLSKMEDNKIKHYIYIDNNTKNIFESKLDINTYRDVTKLLGVFIDNAIDASKDADLKEIELDIKTKDNSVIITITNTFDNSVDITQVGKKGFSTKGVGHGFGLSIVKDIKKNNKDIDIFSDVIDDKFKQTIIIYYK